MVNWLFKTQDGQFKFSVSPFLVTQDKCVVLNMDTTSYLYKTVAFFFVLSLMYQCGYVNGLVDDDDPKASKCGAHANEKEIVKS